MTPSTFLHRQINPSWIQADRITSQAFKPTPKDGGRLSVYDGDQMTASQAWEHYTTALGLRSVGVQSVSVEECLRLALHAAADPGVFPAHAVIIFDPILTKGQIETAAKTFRRLAAARGWQHRPAV